MIESARGETQAICRAEGAPLTGLDAAWPGEQPAAADTGESSEPTTAPISAAPASAATPSPATSSPALGPAMSSTDADVTAAMRAGSDLTAKWTYWAFAALLPGLLLYFSGP